MQSRKRTPSKKPATDSTTTTTESATAVAEPDASATEPAPIVTAEAESAASAPSFVERLGARKAPVVADPFEFMSDYAGGVRLFESRRDRQMALKFDEKPAQAVIDKVKEAGYRWNQEHRVWTHPVYADSARTTRVEAERLYREVSQMIRQEKGIESGPEIPF